MVMSRQDAELAFVREARVGRLATIDSQGFPSVVPFCFALLPGPEPTIVSVLDEKPKRVADGELARVRNIRMHPSVGFVIDRYDEDWSRLAFVQGRGIARMIEAGDPMHSGALAALRDKYPQYRTMMLENRGMIAIAALRLRSWRGDGQPF